MAAQVEVDHLGMLSEPAEVRLEAGLVWPGSMRKHRGMVVVRAIPENGPPVDDPSEYRLFLMFEELEAGRSEFLIVERTADPKGETYVQTIRHDDGTYTVEHRKGSADRHYSTYVSGMRAAHRLVTDWALERPGWDAEHEWERVRL